MGPDRTSPDVFVAEQVCTAGTSCFMIVYSMCHIAYPYDIDTKPNNYNSAASPPPLTQPLSIEASSGLLSKAASPSLVFQ